MKTITSEVSQTTSARRPRVSESGGEERLHGEFREAHLERGAEHQGGGEERQHLLAHPDPERHDHLGLGQVARRRGGRQARAEALGFSQQVDQHRVGSEFDLAAQPRQRMATPLAQVGDPRREPVRMQRQSHHIDRP